MSQGSALVLTCMHIMCPHTAPRAYSSTNLFTRNKHIFKHALRATGDATWDKPAEFVPVVRENPYASTAETDFVKSVLSPKRSKGACSFKQHLNRTSTRAGAGAASAYRLQTMSEDGATAIEALDKSIAEKGRVTSDDVGGKVTGEKVTANRTSLKFKTTLPSTAASP
jgi:hypothetical protein